MKLRIKEIREGKGLTQDDLAKLVNMSRSYLAQIESGARSLTVKKQAAIAAALEVEPGDLVDFTAPGKSDEDLVVEAFRLANPKQREAWLYMARVIKGADPKPETEN